MISRFKPLLIALLALLLIVGVGVGVAFMGRSEPAYVPVANTAGGGGTVTAGPTGTAAPSSAGTATTPAPLSDAQQAELLKVAVGFEHAARDWGSVPDNVGSASNALQDGTVILKALRTVMPNGDELAKYSAIPTDPSWGPLAASPYCTNGKQAMCAEQPSMWEYWSNQDWILGTRHVGEPTASYDESTGTVLVSGTIRMALWSQDLNAAYRGVDAADAYWAFTPVTGTTTYTDRLTITNGKVTARTLVSGSDSWLTDPWYTVWSENPADSTMGWTNRSQPNIPLKGLPPQLVATGQLKPDTGLNMLRNLQDTTSGLWGRVPTSDVPDTSCGAACA